MKQALDLIVGDTWPKRRKVIHLTLMFCAAIILIGMIAAVIAGDMNLIQAIVGSAFLLGGSTISTYVFGSVFDDNDKRRHAPKPPETVE